MKIEGNEVVADKGRYIHRKGSSAYGSRIMLYPTDTIDNFEEVNAVPEEVDVTDYGERVNDLIRAKYSVSEEFAILRQRDNKPEEYQKYYEYCENCKKTCRIENK